MYVYTSDNPLLQCYVIKYRGAARETKKKVKREGEREREEKTEKKKEGEDGIGCCSVCSANVDPRR
jgi:hypothetical protein